MNRRLKLASVALLALMVTSCGTYKRLAYVQDMEPGITYSMPMSPDAKIAKGDKLSIMVTCSTPTLAAPFNIISGVDAVDPTQAVGSEMVAAAGRGDALTTTANTPGYDVDNDGYINFPVLGRIQVEGNTLKQVKDYIEGELISRKYINDPVVVVTFLNFQITMLGDVGVGNYMIPNGKVNMFEALAMAGDLKDTAQRDNIWVIRTVDGKRRLYTINLKTKDCFYSPAFFLQQNDMVYVPPKDNKYDQRITDRNSAINVVFGAIGTIMNVLLWSRMLGR